MNIAILISGHVRSYDKTRENIFRNLITPLRDAGHTCDIYTSTWNNSGYRELGWSGISDKQLIINDSTLIEFEDSQRDEFIQRFNNDKWKYYSHLSGPETCGDAVSMWYKVWKSYKLMQNTKYNIIFRLRPDIMFKDVFNVKLIDDIKPNKIYMAPWHGRYEIINYQMLDHFGFGDFDSMTKYCSIYPDIEKIISRNDTSFTAEGFLYSQICYNKLKVVRIPIRYGILRSYGIDDMTMI